MECGWNRVLDDPLLIVAAATGVVGGDRFESRFLHRGQMTGAKARATQYRDLLCQLGCINQAGRSRQAKLAGANDWRKGQGMDRPRLPFAYCRDRVDDSVGSQSVASGCRARI